MVQNPHGDEWKGWIHTIQEPNHRTSLLVFYCTAQLEALLSQSRQDRPEVRAKSSIGLVALVAAEV